MKRWIGIIAAVLAAVAIALGAFGAHAFKPMLEASKRVETYETAVRYHMYHALALLVLYMLQRWISWRQLQWVAFFWVLGLLFFSGALYILCFTNVSGWAMLAPWGGISLIVGWLWLAAVVAGNW